MDFTCNHFFEFSKSKTCFHMSIFLQFLFIKKKTDFNY